MFAKMDDVSCALAGGLSSSRQVHDIIVVNLMVEKIPFAAPLAADITPPQLSHDVVNPATARASSSIACLFVPFAALWALAWAAAHFGYWELSFLLGIPAAGFLVRLFMIQHDCGHGSFFRYCLERLGRTVSWCFDADALRRLTRAAHMPFIMQTAAIWTDGELAASRHADSACIQASPSGAGFAIASHRHPLVMFGLGAAYQFLFPRHRLPIDLNRGGRQAWVRRSGHLFYRNRGYHPGLVRRHRSFLLVHR